MMKKYMKYNLKSIEMEKNMFGSGYNTVDIVSSDKKNMVVSVPTKPKEVVVDVVIDRVKFKLTFEKIDDIFQTSLSDDLENNELRDFIENDLDELYSSDTEKLDNLKKYVYTLITIINNQISDQYDIDWRLNELSNLPLFNRENRNTLKSKLISLMKIKQDKVELLSKQINDIDENISVLEKENMEIKENNINIVRELNKLFRQFAYYRDEDQLSEILSKLLDYNKYVDLFGRYLTSDGYRTKINEYIGNYIPHTNNFVKHLSKDVNIQNEPYVSMVQKYEKLKNQLNENLNKYKSNMSIIFNDMLEFTKNTKEYNVKVIEKIFVELLTQFE